MEWPKELLDIFEDSLLSDVRPKAAAPSPNDRMAQKLEELTLWVEAQGRLPKSDGALKEKLLHKTLQALRRQKDDNLRQHDRLHLLDENE